MARQVKVQVQGKWYTVEFLTAHGSQLQVRVNGQPAQVQVAGMSLPVSLYTRRLSASVPIQGVQTATPDIGKPKPQAGPADEKHITAPMNGRIVQVPVQTGDRVRPGDEVCVLEAMKMEQSIRVSVAGTVKEIRVLKGQSVTAGELLVELE